MPIDGASVLSGTTVSASGGTALAWSAKTQNGVRQMYVDADTDLRTRRTAVVQTSEPQPSSGAPNGYTQARSKITLKWPRTLTNGNISVDTVRIEIARDVETSSANLKEMKDIAAQFLVDSDFNDFHEHLDES